MGFYQLRSQIELEADIDELWNFISNPFNLKEITPDYMMFDISSWDTPEEIYEGMIISYTVAPLAGIKTRWVTEITHVKEGNYFVDEQRVGPYKLWHHQHIISPGKRGTVMNDIVSYKPPFGILGSLANSIVIKRKLDGIFDYRTRVLASKFGIIG